MIVIGLDIEDGFKILNLKQTQFLGYGVVYDNTCYYTIILKK